MWGGSVFERAEANSHRAEALAEIRSFNEISLLKQDLDQQLLSDRVLEKDLAEEFKYNKKEGQAFQNMEDMIISIDETITDKMNDLEKFDDENFSPQMTKYHWSLFSVEE